LRDTIRSAIWSPLLVPSSQVPIRISMDTVKPKKPSRPPPRLRTKTGCISCRRRRKKCDELKPKCNACERLKLHGSVRFIV
jgi:hypothetical protein